MFGEAPSIAMGGAVMQARQELRRALEQQARDLQVVLTRVMDANALLPAPVNSDWRGLAQLFYGLALRQLTADFDLAEEQLGIALWDTRRAADTLANSVG